MSLLKEDSKYSVWRFNFLENQNQSLLKQGDDLHGGFIGKPLDDLISINCNENEFDGFLLDKTTITAISYHTHKWFLLHQDEKLRIRDNKIILFVYTLCKVDDMILFLVWQIRTDLCHEDKNSWEREYGLEPGLCCKTNYLYSLQGDDKIQKPKGENLESLSEKYCQYKKSYVICEPHVSAHLFNYQNPKARESVQQYNFRIPLTSSSRLSPFIQDTPFHYGRIEKISHLSCTYLYDSLIFENTGQEVKDRNFRDFIADSLLTCFYYQQDIAKTRSSTNIEQHLLSMSFYF